MREPAEILTCDLVELRRWRTDDLDALERVIGESLDHLVPWMPWASDPPAREDLAGFLDRNRQEWESGRTFAYGIHAEGTLAGSCGLYRRVGPGVLDIGYWLHPHRTGRGLATMTVMALVGEGLRLSGVRHVQIRHDAANGTSGAVARRAGLTEAGRGPTPEGITAPGEVGIEVVWRVTADEWAARH